MAATADQISQIAAALEACDSVDGYSLVGVADIDTVDVDDNPIVPGSETIDFYDGDGNYLYSCEKDSADGYAEPGVADADTIDSDGNPIEPGSPVIDFYDETGMYFGSVPLGGGDGWAEQGVADADTIDSDGNPIAPGTKTVDFYDSEGMYVDSLALRDVITKSGDDMSADNPVMDLKTIGEVGGWFSSFPGYKDETVSCEPLDPTECPEIPRLYCEPVNGDLWQWDGAAMDCCQVNPSVIKDCEILDNVYTITGQEIIDLATNSPNTQVPYIVYPFEYENDECVPVQVEVRFRSHTGANLFHTSANGFIQIALQMDNFQGWAGKLCTGRASTHSYSTFSNPVLAGVVQGDLNTWMSACVPPKSTATLDFSVLTTVNPGFTDLNPASSITMGSDLLEINVTRKKEIV